MPALSTVYIQEFTRQTHTGDTAWTDVSATTTGNLTSGVPYLIIASATLSNDSAQQPVGCRLLHGSTAFDGSEARQVADEAPAIDRTYQFATIYTPGTAEALKIQLKCFSATNTIGADNVNIMAIPLDHVTASSDYYFDDQTTPVDMSAGTVVNGATLTFTPGTAGHDWLIIGTAQVAVDQAIAGDLYSAWLAWSGGVTSTNPRLTFEGQRAGGVVEQLGNTALVVRNLAASSHTITWKADLNSAGDGSESLVASTLCAIDLTATFSDYAFECNPGSGNFTNITTTDFGQEIATTTLTPSAAADVLVLGLAVHDATGVGDPCTSRLQADNSDLNTDVTTSARPRNRTEAATEFIPHNLMGIDVSATAASHTYDLDMGAAEINQNIGDECILAIAMLYGSEVVTYKRSINHLKTQAIHRASLY